MEHLWDKRRNKELRKTSGLSLSVDLFLFSKHRSLDWQAAERQAAGHDEILSVASADGVTIPHQTVFNLPHCGLVLASIVATVESPGRLLETDEHLSLGPHTTVKLSACCSANLHKIGAKRSWLGFQAPLFLLPRCYGHHYLSPFTRMVEQDRPPIRISIKMESLPHTDMKIRVLRGKLRCNLAATSFVMTRVYFI